MPNLISPDNPILWARAAEVKSIPDEVSPHIPWMRDFLIRSHGLGLAAPQIGVSLRFFLWRNASIFLVVNPVVLNHGPDTEVKVEGCFSFPGRVTARRRYKEIEVRFLDERGCEQTRQLKGMNARVFQHEMDHLAGVNLFPRPKEPTLQLATNHPVVS